MECSEPGAIHDEDFAAYLAGREVRSEVVQHLAHCQACSSQIAAYQQLDRQLVRRLYRWDCPSSQELGEYQLGLLDAIQLDVVRLHLLTCQHCTAEIAALTEFLANDPRLVEPVAVQRPVAASANHRRPVQEVLRTLDQWREQAVEETRRVVAALLPPQPRLALQRDLSARVNSWPRNYIAEDVSISVQVEQMPQQRDVLQIIGLIRRTGSALEALEGTPVRLISQAGVVETENVDDLGNFVFAAVAPDTYSLEVHIAENIVVIEQLPISPIV
jgi:anti-sigma factor RsiW